MFSLFIHHSVMSVLISVASLFTEPHVSEGGRATFFKEIFYDTFKGGRTSTFHLTQCSLVTVVEPLQS